MKRSVLLSASLLFLSFNSFSQMDTGNGPGNNLAETFQVHECKFGNSIIELTPNNALTVLLKKEVKNAVVYKVKYNKGSFQVGPKYDLAIIDELPSKTLAVSFFDHDENDGLTFLNQRITIDLKSPISIEDEGLINFEAELNDTEASEGTCALGV